jgi:hypothetical protein
MLARFVKDIGFEVHAEVVMKTSAFWNITPCSPLNRLHLQGQNINRARNKRESRSLLAACFHADILLGLFFDLEDRGDMFLRNVG